jgi:RNA-directed DNA polymerase
MIERARQALYLLGLEPISETLADKNAYGFRPKRGVADAIAQCFVATSRGYSPQWILEGDIKACFDKIGHQWLSNNIPMDKTILNQWLKSGYIDKGMFYRTDSGTPQGGVISPTLCVMTLRGLEQAVKSVVTHRSDKINFISYADDFIVTGGSKEVLEEKVKPVISEFLKERGLELSEEKTLITHISQGFNFLGFNIRKYDNGKLLTKPAKENVLKFVANIKEIMIKHKTIEAGELIRILNPKIMGWGKFYRHAAAKRTFSYVDHRIFELLYRWAMRRHPNKSKTWVVDKYFSRCDRNMGNWNFYGYTTVGEQKVKIFLSEMASIPIKRHIKIRGDANPYDPAYDEYFKKRREQKTPRNHWHDTLPTAL